MRGDTEVDYNDGGEILVTPSRRVLSCHRVTAERSLLRRVPMCRLTRREDRQKKEITTVFQNTPLVGF